MPLIRQLRLLLAATMAIALIGSVAVNASAARSYLLTQLQLKNNDNAQALALSLSLSLSSQQGDPALLELAIAAQFDTGSYERIHLATPGGATLVDKRASLERSTLGAPAWFVKMLPIEVAAGVAQVTDGWRPVGTLTLASASGFAHAHLWQGTLRSTGWLLFVGGLAAVLAGLVLRRIQAPLNATVAQARALSERRFVTVPEPQVPELREVSHAMNAMVQRLQAVFGEQGAQLEALRVQAQADPLTGVSNRAHFFAGLQALPLRDDAPPHATLLLLRVRSLMQLNRQLGHGDVNAALQALARALQARHTGLLPPGRLNGSDFAVLVHGPDAEAALAEVARHIDAVRSALAAWPGASVSVGGAAWAADTPLPALMQAADAALVRAEARGDFALALDPTPGSVRVPPLGEADWRQRLGRALQPDAVGVASLGAFPVVGRDGRLLHLECPLRLRLVDGGPLEPAAHWLPWALRCGLSTAVDGLALALALARSEADGQPRCVNLAPDSLRDAGFVAGLRSQLQAQPRAAALLWLELAEPAATAQLELLRELGRQLRPLGVKLGIEHAGAQVGGIARLYEAGLDYVKLEAALSSGIAGDTSRTSFVRGLVGTLKSLGMQVMAEGVADAADAQALWACGVDGITGPAVPAMV
ncbi:MAG: hypothetical protein AD742_15340 [Methylibium sp. NZG]|nr:MAG: hypothetical protein AD742_15340 [Methylibium sp. NZG]